MPPKQERDCQLPISKMLASVRMQTCPQSCYRRERGVFAVMTAPLLLVLVAFCGLALDIGYVYNRVVDLNGLSKSVALAAARELNGTSAGIAAAQAKARSLASGWKFRYFGNGSAVIWNDAALSFGGGSSRSGTWLDAAAASGQASNLYFAKVDTAALDTTMTTVNTFLMRAISSNFATVALRETAVAGRTEINVAPIGICAMGVQASARSYTLSNGSTVTELVQYGFRRGVSYDLMQLNPNGTQAVRYAINPFVAAGASGDAFSTSYLGQFVCKGTMWVSKLTGGPIRVSALPSTSPLASLYIPLNSRFDAYGGGPCDPSGAPPDFNVKGYAYDQSGTVRWMNPVVGNAAAVPTTTRGRLETVADLTTPPSSPGNYGPLWAFAKAVKAPTPLTAPEPSNGYTAFSTSDWPAIYKSGPTASNYPSFSATPYQSTSGASGHYLAPQASHLDISTLQRRVLNIPLLSCSPSAPTGSNTPATVQAIGRFFMTVPATQDKLIAEFAGTLPETSLSGQVKIFP